MFSEGRGPLPLSLSNRVSYLLIPFAKLGEFPKLPNDFEEISQINFFKNASPLFLLAIIGIES